MRGYGQFCPVAKASEVFAERWTPLVIRELVTGSHRFSQIHSGVPRMSRTLLAQRLRSLEREGIIERRTGPGGRGAEYHLTPAGDEFREVIELLGAWGQRWSGLLDAEGMDLDLAMVATGRCVRTDRLPERRVVVQFDLRDKPRERWWLVLERAEVDVCLKDPGYEPDLFITTDGATLVRIHLGRLNMADAIRQGLMELDGPRWLVRDFPGWIGTSPTVGWKRKWESSRGLEPRTAAV